MYLHPCRADLNHPVAQRWETLVEVETYVLRGLDSTAPVSSTIPTPTLLAEPSMPRTLGIFSRRKWCGSPVPEVRQKWHP